MRLLSLVGLPVPAMEDQNLVAAVAKLDGVEHLPLLIATNTCEGL